MAGTTTIFDKDDKPIIDPKPPFGEGPVDPDFGQPPPSPPDFGRPDNELPGLGGRPGLQPDNELPGAPVGGGPGVPGGPGVAGPRPDNSLPDPIREGEPHPEPPIVVPPVVPPVVPVEPPVEPPTQPVEVYDEVGKASIAFQEAERDKQLELQQLKRDQEAAAKKALDDGFHQAQALPPEPAV